MGRRRTTKSTKAVQRKEMNMKTTIFLTVAILILIALVIFARIAWADDYLVTTSTGSDGRSSTFVSGPHSYYGQGSTNGGNTFYTDGSVQQ